MISVQQKGGHLQLPGFQSTPQAKLEVCFPDVKGSDRNYLLTQLRMAGEMKNKMYTNIWYLKHDFVFIKKKYSITLGPTCDQKMHHKLHIELIMIIYFLGKMPWWVFWDFSALPGREIINETFDGILGANSRASSSYSACRPIQINKSGHLSATHRLCLSPANAPHQTYVGGKFQNHMRSPCSCSPV